MKRSRRKTRYTLALLLLTAVVAGHLAGVFRGFRPEETASSHRHRSPCDLVRILDGDTIVVHWRGREEHVRLLRINTPERGQPGYRESSDYLREFLTGQVISLEFEEPHTPARDRYGRLLAYVFAGSRNANLEIVRAGWSPFWTRYGRGKYAEAFEQAESEAKDDERGLWGKMSTPPRSQPGPEARLPEPVAHAKAKPPAHRRPAVSGPRPPLGRIAAAVSVPFSPTRGSPPLRAWPSPR